MNNPGARPTGTASEQAAATTVREMFDSIAPRYDLLNHLLSANIDRAWWRRAADEFHAVLAQPDALIIDLCCGTGDMTAALLKHRPTGARPIIGIDFSSQMLARARTKYPGSAVEWIQADALALPLENSSADLVVSAFGFRNLANYSAGLAEISRVLKPQGQIGILDFQQPDGAFGKFFAIYFRHILPRLGRLISGSGPAYSYLPASVAAFPQPPAMLALMRQHGFANPAWAPYTFGIAGLYSARKPAL